MKPNSHTSAPVAPTVIYYIVHGRHLIIADYVAFVRLQLADLEGQLPPRERYGARDLIGHRCWAELTPQERREVGSVISHLVSIGDLPLTKQEKRGKWLRNEYAAKT